MYWGKKKFTDYYGHECENTFGMPLVHHRAELAPGMLKVGLFPVFWVDYKAIGVSCVKYGYVGIE